VLPWAYSVSLRLQNVFSRMKKVIDPSSMGAILCGQKQMAEVLSYCLVCSVFISKLRNWLLLDTTSCRHN
jgi:hypothetical protein